MWLTTLSGQLPINALVGRYPTNKLIGRNPLPKQKVPKDPHRLPKMRCLIRGPSGITPRFQGLFRSRGQVGYAVLTLSPLSAQPKLGFSLDLHA